jgi:hypothetical protein
VTPLALVQVQAATRQTLTDHLVAQVRALVEGFTGWYDDVAVARLAKQISGLVTATQTTAAVNEDAYLTQFLRSATGKSVSPAGAISSNVVADLRRGVDPEQVYQRLGETYRYAESTGASPEKALATTVTRAAVMNDTDISLATRAQDHKTLAVTHLATGYRRVIHPELAKGGTCGMCIVASDRVYKKSELLPIHDRCHCTVAPILANGEDPGSGLNNLDLTQLYSDAEGTQAPDLKRTRYDVNEHGELGAVLVPKKRAKKPKGPNTVPANLDLTSLSDARLQQLLEVTDKRPASADRTATLARLHAEQMRRLSRAA